MQRSCADYARQSLRKLPRIPIRKRTTEVLAGDQPKNAVAEEFQALIVRAIGRLAMRAVRERAIELLGTLEMVAEDRFEFGALLWCHGAFTSPLFWRRGLRGGLLLGVGAHLFATILQAAGHLRALLECIRGFGEALQTSELHA